MPISDAPEPKKPIKEIVGKNYVLPFGKWINTPVYVVIERDPQWLLENDGVRFNLHPRIRDAVMSAVSTNPQPPSIPT